MDVLTPTISKSRIDSCVFSPITQAKNSELSSSSDRPDPTQHDPLVVLVDPHRRAWDRGGSAYRRCRPAARRGAGNGRRRGFFGSSFGSSIGVSAGIAAGSSFGSSFGRSAGVAFGFILRGLHLVLRHRGRFGDRALRVGRRLLGRLLVGGRPSSASCRRSGSRTATRLRCNR